ncbi:aminotransferase DegT [Candidatus Woesearchaeota archaeon CG11_big_fil_rev_8_21_14_0_20_43_8]|nr:MAG: aminotransferase DegT [Candidatus Woesearchaeota archaeon CG11_big_fil_rev_8_21_14_0_20_43_8]
MIPLVRPIMGEEEKKAVMAVLDSGMIAQGPKVAELEERFAAMCGTKHAIAVTSGTAALHASLHCLGVRPGDEVITTPFTFAATANSAIMCGAKPVFVDIDEDTFNIDPEAIKEKITKKTKAMIPVDLYGQIYDPKIDKIAKDNNVFVVEDACQAVCASSGGKMAGSFGHMAAFSFYATKNMMCGEGGMITTDSDEFAELCRRFRHHGQSQQTRYQYHDLGYNYRMTDIQAAIALVQLDRIKELTDKRIANAKLLDAGLKKISWLKTPHVASGNKHVYHQYTIRLKEDAPLSRDVLLEKLKDAGIGCGVYYPKPLHLHPNFARFGYNGGDFPLSEAASLGVISLPVHPMVTRENIKYMIEFFEGIE